MLKTLVDLLTSFSDGPDRPDYKLTTQSQKGKGTRGGTSTLASSLAGLIRQMNRRGKKAILISHILGFPKNMRPKDNQAIEA